MTQGVPGEDEMTSRADGPTDEERAEFKRGELQAVRDLMCNHDLDYDLETLAVHVESFMDPMGTEEPSYLRGKQAGLKLAAALIRDRISSSSATETQDEQPDWETPEQTERRIARDSAWTPLRQAATETQDGERPGLRAMGKELIDLLRADLDVTSHTLVAARDFVDAALATPTPDDRDREVECVSCDDDHDANIHDHHWHDLDKTTYIGIEHGRELTDSEDAAENATWD